MSASLDSALLDRVAALVREVAEVEAARPTIEAEIAAEMAKLDLLAVQAEAASSWWLSSSPQVTPSGVSNSIAAGLMLVNPVATKKIATERVRRACAAWVGLRMSEDDKQRKLSKLRAELRVARARCEAERRKIEATTGEMQPRVGDDPAVWLLPPDQLNALAASSSNGRTQR